MSVKYTLKTKDKNDWDMESQVNLMAMNQHRVWSWLMDNHNTITKGELLDEKALIEMMYLLKSTYHSLQEMDLFMAGRHSNDD